MPSTLSFRLSTSDLASLLTKQHETTEYLRERIKQNCIRCADLTVSDLTPEFWEKSNKSAKAIMEMNWAVYLLGMLISNKRHEIPSSILLKNESDLDKLIASGQSAVIDEIYAAFEKAKSY